MKTWNLLEGQQFESLLGHGFVFVSAPHSWNPMKGE